MNQALTLQPIAGTRERLLHTALECFSTHGYQSTSLRDLASLVGVQPGSLYNHIENKQSLLFELMEQAMYDLLHRTRLSLKGKRTALSELRLFVQTFVTFQSSDARKLALIDREIFNLSSTQQARITALRNEYAQSLVSIINAVAGASFSKSRTVVLVRAVIGMLQSVAPGGEEDISVSPMELIDELTHIIIGAIRATNR